MFKAAVLNLFAVVMLVSATEIPPQEDSVVTLDTLTAANENEPSPDTLPPSQTKPESVQKDSSKAGIEVSATAGTPVARESDSVSVSGDTVTLGQAESGTVPEDTLESGEADTLVLQQEEEVTVEEEVVEEEVVEEEVVEEEVAEEEVAEEEVVEEEVVEEEVVEEEGGLEKMPELTTFVEAEYPRECIREGIEGVVLLELLVNEEGKVDSAAVVNGVHPLLDSSAAEAARAFLFSPAVAGGEDVAVMLQYEYRFSLREAVSTPDAYVNFTGRILERGTRKPIEEAMVVVEFLDTLSDTSLGMPFSLYLEQIAKLEGQSLEEGRMIVLTDSNGQFTFRSLPTCRVEVTFPVSGYEPYWTEERISRQEVVEATYYLRRHSYSDFEVTVYGRAEEKEVSRHQLTVAEVKKIPGLGGDAVKVVQALPGVGRPSFGGTDIIVRGAPTWDSRYFLDGVTIPLVYHFGGLKSVYNSEALESVDFYPGGFSTRYGGGVAGVIELTGRKAKRDRYQGTVDMNFMDASFLAEGPVNEKVSVIASGRRNFVGDILSAYFDNAEPNTYQVAVAPFYWDYLLRTDVDVNEDHGMFFTLFGARDSMGVFFPRMRGGSSEISEDAENFTMKILFHMLTMGAESKIGDKWTNSLRLSGTYAKDRFSAFGLVIVEESSYMGHLRNQLSYKASDRVIVNAGLDMSLLNHNMVLIMPNARNVIVRDTTEDWLFGDIGAYLNMEYKPTKKFQLIPGIRYDYYPELDYRGSVVPEFWPYESFNNKRGKSGEPSLRVNARYEQSKEHVFKAAAGTYNQTPQPMGQVIHETWGEPDLPATKAAQYVAGYEYHLSDLVSLDMQTYYNRQWDIPRMGAGNESKKYYSDGKGRMYGLEMMLRHDKSERFFGWLAYTLSRSERWDRDLDKYIVYGQDETHHIQLLGSWHLDRDWDLGFRARYVTGKPTTPVIGIEESEDGNYIYALYGERNSARYDPFFQIDLRADKKWIMDKWIFSTYLELQNVSWFFYKSPEFTSYNYNYKHKSVGSMIPLISLGFKSEF